MVGKVNFLRDTAEIKIFYDDPRKQFWLEATEAEYDSNGESDEDVTD